jgi:predicted DNA-binding transcriptional regulator AlpA
MDTLSEQRETAGNGGQTAGILQTGGFIEPEQLAAELGISARTLARWDTARQGPPKTKLGKRNLYRRESVIAWLEAQEARQGRTNGRRAARRARQA